MISNISSDHVQVADSKTLCGLYQARSMLQVHQPQRCYDQLALFDS